MNTAHDMTLAGSAAAAHGLVLVPREPTPAMVDAFHCEVGESASNKWNAMIAAAPSATSLAEVATSGWLQTVREPDPTKLQWDDGDVVVAEFPGTPTIAECIAQLDVWNGHLEAAIDRQAHETLGQHPNDDQPLEHLP